MSDNFYLINLRTREYWTDPICNLYSTPKLMQSHYKLRKIEKSGINGMTCFFCKIICLLVNLFPSASFHYKRKVSKNGGAYKRRLQKSKFLNSLVNWEKFKSTVKACFRKSQFSNFIMNWNKLRSPERATFKKTPKSLCELERTWKYSLKK